jgi:hypothetical protein
MLPKVSEIIRVQKIHQYDLKNKYDQQNQSFDNPKKKQQSTFRNILKHTMEKSVEEQPSAAYTLELGRMPRV